MGLNGVVSVVQYLIFATVPAVGFGMVFNLPKKALKYCGIGGAFSHSTRTILLDAGASLELASFFAALIVGF